MLAIALILLPDFSHSFCSACRLRRRFAYPAEFWGIWSGWCIT